MSAALTLTIERLGHRGDGIARDGVREWFVPYALPGERILAEPGDGERARLTALESQSPDRVAPICNLFMRCGGCATQHYDLSEQLVWKRGLVAEALRQRGIAAEVEDCLDAHGDGRRRVTLHLRMVDGAMRAGFMAARSHRLVPVEACPVLASSLARAPHVAEALGALPYDVKKPLDAQITASAAGLDVDLRGAGKISDALRLKLIDMGRRLDLARLSLHGDVLAEWREPALAVGAARVTPPAGGFLQATQAGEEALAGLALENIGKAKHVADLFSGCGAFALRLAATARVHAVESDKPALDALTRAARGVASLKPVSTEARDLFRRPLLPQELDAFDAVLFDPPRAGAEEQARMMAKTRKLKTIVAVSCNAATFARDARILIDGGFALARVTPVDQFRHSPHVELVAAFRR
jgi:23S rRNA (uracil1939-C5)-methyltransferase